MCIHVQSVRHVWPLGRYVCTVHDQPWMRSSRRTKEPQLHSGRVRDEFSEWWSTTTTTWRMGRLRARAQTYKRYRQPAWQRRHRFGWGTSFRRRVTRHLLPWSSMQYNSRRGLAFVSWSDFARIAISGIDWNGNSAVWSSWKPRLAEMALNSPKIALELRNLFVWLYIVFNVCCEMHIALF